MDPKELQQMAANMEAWADLVTVCEALAMAAERAIEPDEAVAIERVKRRFRLQSDEHHQANIRILEGLARLQ